MSLAGAGAGVAHALRARDVEDDGTLAATHLREKRTLQSHLAYGAGGASAGLDLAVRF